MLFFIPMPRKFNDYDIRSVLGKCVNYLTLSFRQITKETKHINLKGCMRIRNGNCIQSTLPGN